MKLSKVVSRRCRPLLGTFVEISIESFERQPQVKIAHVKAFELAFVAIEKVAAVMSFHDEHSELSALNRAPVGQWVRIGSSLWEVLSLALNLQQRTAGVFNVAIAGPLISCGRLPGRKSRIDWRHLDRAGFEIDGLRARRIAPIKIDLGGIAKGFAVDQAVEVISKMDTGSTGCVNAGGDLRVFGPGVQSVGIRGSGGFVELVRKLQNQSVATSTVRGSNGNSSYINPRRQNFLMCSRTVSVVSKSCAIADALTKVVLHLPSGSCAAVADQFEAKVIFHQ